MIEACFKDAVCATSVSIATGAAITWFFAWWYYRAAGRELRDEAKLLREETARVRQALNAVAAYMQNSENPNASSNFERDSAGNVIGTGVTVRVRAGSAIGGGARASIIPGTAAGDGATVQDLQGALTDARRAAAVRDQPASPA